MSKPVITKKPNRGNNSIRERDPIAVELERRFALLHAGHAIQNGEVTVERLEFALAVAAYIMSRDGPKIAPIYERLERELAAMRRQEDTLERARQLLQSYRPPASQPLSLPPPMERRLLLTSEQ
jgi:hypothetical protein